MPFTILNDDITTLQVDAIVNETNTDLQAESDRSKEIFVAAGFDALRNACQALAPIGVGEAVITSGFQLPAKYIIHTAGPVNGGGPSVEELLRSCYLNSLKLALKNHCESIAFPLLSDKNQHLSGDGALKIAQDAITGFIKDSEENIHVFLLVENTSPFPVHKKLLREVEDYIEDHYIDEDFHLREFKYFPSSIDELEDRAVRSTDASPSRKAALDKLVENLDEPFSDTLFRLIDKKGRTDVEVYKRANIDRKLFSKIRSVKNYTPGKRTVLALSIALELSLPETQDLLARAGYALSHSHKFDVIIEYFIVSGKYDIFEINEVLFHYDQPLLGG